MLGFMIRVDIPEDSPYLVRGREHGTIRRHHKPVRGDLEEPLCTKQVYRVKPCGIQGPGVNGQAEQELESLPGLHELWHDQTGRAAAPSVSLDGVCDNGVGPGIIPRRQEDQVLTPDSNITVERTPDDQVAHATRAPQRLLHVRRV